MKYIIWDNDGNPLTAQVSKLEDIYFKDHILSNLKPISKVEYTEGFAAILRTLSKFSYIIFNNKLYWLIEWHQD